jgi:hypothetical protein
LAKNVRDGVIDRSKLYVVLVGHAENDDGALISIGDVRLNFDMQLAAPESYALKFKISGSTNVYVPGISGTLSLH